MDFQTIATSSVAATIASVVLNRAIEWQKNGARARAVLNGILLELNHAQRCAAAYLEDSRTKPWRPGYRIVTEFLQSGIASLAQSGSLKSGETSALHQLYIDAGEANRSLDLLTDIGSRGGPTDGTFGRIVPDILINESSRARVKFQNVLEHLPAAQAAVQQALNRLQWFESQD